jgi:hypothetical protein
MRAVVDFLSTVDKLVTCILLPKIYFISMMIDMTLADKFE